jgi:ABC-type glycerol-3-phosphate transport system substrate-binding protein
MEGYLDWDEISFLYQQGFFSRHDPRYIQLWRILKHWRKYFGKDISTADTTRLFIMQKGAMFWQFSGFVQKLTKDPDIDFDWGVFYPPPIPEEYNKYCDGHSMCVIGGAAVQLCVSNSSYKDTGDPATSERLKRCIAFLQFLTTPENTHEVVNEMTFFLPNIRGVDPRPELKYFDEILRRRYTTTKWFYTFDLKFNEILLRTLELYLNDGISEEDFLLWMEDNMDAAVTNVIRRKDLDLSNLEDEWKNLAPQRKDAEGLPDEPQNAL